MNDLIWLSYTKLNHTIIMRLQNFSTKLGILLLILFSISTITCNTLAQSSSEDLNVPGSLSINMSATELIPADLIIFNINLNVEAKTSQEAFKLHKEKESLLASLLKEFKIDEKDINYQPVQFSKRYPNYNNRREYVVGTSQSVSLSFSNFSIYEEIQLTLIENGFDSFNGNFSSSKTEEGKTKALAMAIQKAKDRAQFIAEQSGVNVKSITKISYSDHQINRPPMVMESAMMKGSASDSMMDFAQTVSVTANISIEFFITD